MKRALIIAGLLLGAASPLAAQTTGVNDREIERFVLPGTNTTGFRVHGARAHMNLTLPAGNIIAVGGYKVAFAYAHPENMKPSLTNQVMPLVGTARANDSGSGVAYQRTPFGGSVIGIAIGASTALTAGSATAEATVRIFDGSVLATGLTAVISGTGATQYNATAQARTLDNFTTSDGIGCRITTTSDLAPVTAEIVCTVVVEF